MTTLDEFLTAFRADVRPDVRTSAHRPKHRRRPASGLWLHSPWWLVVIVGTVVSVLFSLGAVAYSIPSAA